LYVLSLLCVTSWIYAQPQDKPGAQFVARECQLTSNGGLKLGCSIEQEIAITPASGASLVVMVDSYILDGRVVLPMIDSDSQLDYSEEVELSRQLQVRTSDPPSETPTVLQFGSEEDREDLRLLSEDEMDQIINQIANQPVPDTQGDPFDDQAENQYLLGGQSFGPQMRTSDCMRSHSRSRSPIHGQWVFIESGTESPRSPPRRALANRHMGMHMSSGEMFRHILTVQSGAQRALVITGEEHMMEAVEHCNRAVGSIVHSGLQFYIGITEHHSRRWEEHQVAAPGMWVGINILVQAPNSRLTSQLERRLIAQWGHHWTCRNIGPGGEHASQGQPHYVYCLQGDRHGFIRHCGR
jgi:hypothetical protein